jgi:hypothetical protein
MRFRLRTLMTVVTLLSLACAYVGWQAKIARERTAMLDTGSENSIVRAVLDKEKDGAVPTIRLWFGDHFCRSVYVKHSADVQRYQTTFPEADVWLLRRQVESEFTGYEMIKRKSAIP